MEKMKEFLESKRMLQPNGTYGDGLELKPKEKVEPPEWMTTKEKLAFRLGLKIAHRTDRERVEQVIDEMVADNLTDTEVMDALTELKQKLRENEQ